MKIYTKLLKTSIILSFLNLNLQAELLDGISAIVNNKPITLSQIHSLANQENLSIKEALNLLIQRRLEQSQIEQLGIKANSFEISQEIENIAKNNGMSGYELINILKSKGISEERYKKDVENIVQNRKLFRHIFKSKSPLPSEFQIEKYYEKHKEEFVSANSFQVVKYKAANMALLNEQIQNPLRIVDGVTIQKEILQARFISPKDNYYLNQTSENSYTPPLEDEHGFKSYFVEKKLDLSPLSFEQAKANIQNILIKENEKIAVENYFQKLKSKANITFLRKP